MGGMAQYAYDKTVDQLVQQYTCAPAMKPEDLAAKVARAGEASKAAFEAVGAAAESPPMNRTIAALVHAYASQAEPVPLDDSKAEKVRIAGVKAERLDDLAAKCKRAVDACAIAAEAAKPPKASEKAA